MSVNHLLRNLPQVGQLLASPEWQHVLRRYSRSHVKAVLEQELERLRQQIRKGVAAVPEGLELLARVEGELARLANAGPRPVLNATGVIIHTNLGRAPLAAEAVAAATRAAVYCDLEIDLGSGERGSRHNHVAGLLCRLTGAEGAMVVNNNAAAVLLALAAVAAGREAIISRGQLVEIGGSFRIPEVMAQSGVRLVEVGTTNKTYLDDYRRAIGADTGVLLRVHPSNYRIMGFHYQASLEELVRLGREHNLPVLDDLGSGTLVDLRPWGIDEPTVQQSVAAGADLVCFSGDKLLGGPQCGIIVGKGKWVAMLKKHPLARAMRCDKVTLAALAATLGLYMQPDGWRRVPVLAMLTEPLELVGKRADLLKNKLGKLPVPVAIEEDLGAVGGGALPLHHLQTVTVSLAVQDPVAVAARLRQADPPLVCRVREDKIILDMRTLADNQLEQAARVVNEVLGGESK